MVTVWPPPVPSELSGTSHLMETVRYMEVTRAQLPIGSETLNSGPSSAASGPSNSDCHTTQ